MMKQFKLVAILLALCLTGCGSTARSASSGPASSQGPASVSSAAGSHGDSDEVPGAWGQVSGSYARDDSNQYDNGILQMKYLSDSCVMFEFNLMAGSESEDSSETLTVPFVLLVDDNGKGHYESDPEAKNPLSIDFKLSDDGKQVTVTHTGEILISCDGVYKFTNSELEVSETSATSILSHLPTAATSLNGNNGAYTIHPPESIVGNWFYPVQATFNDTGKVLAKFLIAKDLSAVYRADDDIDPVLIFGSAQPMLDAKTSLLSSDEDKSDVDSDAQVSELSGAKELSIVSVGLKDGTSLVVGAKSQLTTVFPWELPHTLTAKSSNPKVATVDENGIVTTVAAGTATISGTLTVDDGTKDFSINLTVEESAPATEAIK